MTHACPSSGRPGAPTRPDWDAYPSWVVGALAAMVALLLYLPTATWDYDQVTDTRATAIAGWSLAERGTIAVDTSWPDVPWAEHGRNDAYYVWRHPGGIVWTSLFYLPGRSSLEPTSALDIPYGPGTASAVVATALGVGAMAMVFRRLAPARTSFAASLTLGLATSNWSISADAPWNHGPTLLLLALGLLASSASRHVWAGVSLGAAITVRPHVAVAPACLGIAAALREKRLAPALRVGLPSFAGLLTVMWFYGHFFGQASMRPEQVGAFVSGDVNLTDHGWGMNLLLSLFDAQRGLFVFSPFLLVLMWGLRPAWRQAPTWVRGAAVSAVLYALIQTRADVYHAGGGFFGYRAHLETVTLAAPLLLLAYRHYFEHRPRLRVVTEATIMASVIVFAIGSTNLGPIGGRDSHCWIQRYVGIYRPREEQIEAARQSFIDCGGVSSDEADRILEPLVRTHG